MGLLNKIEIASIFLYLISWKWIFRLTVVLIIGAILTLGNIHYFLNTRPSLYQDKHVKLLTVSNDVKKNISEIIKKTPAITAVQVVTLNFHKNIRAETYMDINNPAIREAYNLYLKRKIVEIPLFTTDKDTNDRVFNIINGEFTCASYKDSMAYKYIPQADQVSVTDVCYLGIPPYNNNMSGIISVYLKYHPDDAKKREIYLSLREISNKIYGDSFP